MIKVAYNTLHSIYQSCKCPTLGGRPLWFEQPILRGTISYELKFGRGQYSWQSKSTPFTTSAAYVDVFFDLLFRKYCRK